MRVVADLNKVMYVVRLLYVSPQQMPLLHIHIPLLWYSRSKKLKIFSCYRKLTETVSELIYIQDEKTGCQRDELTFLGLHGKSVADYTDRRPSTPKPPTFKDLGHPLSKGLADLWAPGWWHGPESWSSCPVSGAGCSAGTRSSPAWCCWTT